CAGLAASILVAALCRVTMSVHAVEGADRRETRGRSQPIFQSYNPPNSKRGSTRKTLLHLLTTACGTSRRFVATPPLGRYLRHSGHAQERREGPDATRLTRLGPKALLFVAMHAH